MLRELGPKIFFHQDGGGGGGGHIREGRMIFPSPHDLGGIHFHSDKLPTLDEATVLLRDKGWLKGPKGERVIAIARWGKNKRGVEGFAAVTNLMANCGRAPIEGEIVLT